MLFGWSSANWGCPLAATAVCSGVDSCFPAPSQAWAFLCAPACSWGSSARNRAEGDNQS